jgi:hypothetical protein
MRAVMVVVLPEITGDDPFGEALAVQMRAVASALDIPEMKDGRLIAAIRDTADAILQAAE